LLKLLTDSPIAYQILLLQEKIGIIHCILPN